MAKIKQKSASSFDCSPILHINDITALPHGATIYSKINLARACHQIPFASEAVEEKDSTTLLGLFEFLSMLFGSLSTAQSF